MIDRLGPYLLGPNDTLKNGIYTGDAKELAKAIPDESVDLIFTDPPYPKEFLPLYEWLAEEAARVLKPEGFLLALCGQYHLNRIFEMLDRHLTYFWKYEIGLPGWAACIVWPNGNTKVNIIARCKPLLAYTRTPGALPRTSTMAIFAGSGRDKRYHAWGQDVVSARYFIDCFSSVGDIVWDPLVGGGTTCEAARLIGRRWLAFELEPAAATVARERLRLQPPLFVPEPEQLDLALPATT